MAALSLGFTIHYNYLREHMALKTTPAEAARINLPFYDGWRDLIIWATHWHTFISEVVKQS